MLYARCAFEYRQLIGDARINDIKDKKKQFEFGEHLELKILKGFALLNASSPEML